MGIISYSNQTDKKRTRSEERASNSTPNLEFHQGKPGCVKPRIQKHIENWESYKNEDLSQFYEDLESDHSFIQWIFPNFFKSMFNYDSYRLTIEERNLMIMDKKVMEQFLKNYHMFLRFLGIQVQDSQFNLEDERQFDICLFQNTHNQLRLQRVLASLSVLNQRKEALNLLSFLEKTLQKKEGKSLYNRTYKNYEKLKEEMEQDQPQLEVKQEQEEPKQLERQISSSPTPSKGDIDIPSHTEVLSDSQQEFSQQQILQKQQQQEMLTWETQKTYYVQRDLLNEVWVNVKLLM